MKKFVGLLMIVTLFAASISAQNNTSIAGNWDVAITGGPDGHHPPSAVFEIEQKGTKITGNFMIPDHGDLPVEGEFQKGKLTLHSTEDAFMQFTLTGTLKDDGTLGGTIESQMGTMTWTAKRI